MTTKELISAIKLRYPNTYIGLDSYHKQVTNKPVTFEATYNNVPLDFAITKIINYLEYREINFIEALCNAQVDNVTDNHETVRFKAITGVMNRLEKFIVPAEGQPF